MKIQQILESQFEYEVGDRVNTPFGEGVIVKQLNRGEEDDVYFAVVFDDRIRKLYDLPARPIRLGSFQLKGIVKKGSNF